MKQTAKEEMEKYLTTEDILKSNDGNYQKTKELFPDFISWVERSFHRADIIKKIKFYVEDQEVEHASVTFYTEKHYYKMSIYPKYLGCVMSSRLPRAGEEHIRGMDLLNGKNTIKTWNRMLGAIISTELKAIGEY